jgi:aldehyde dehydrogenase (NAD+)
VFKPASDTPASAVQLAEALLEAGLPDGVLNVVFGGGNIAGEALLEHPDVDLISFTGSSPVGRKIAEVTGRNLKRCSLELGGKNAQIVMPDADLDLALEGVLWGAFGTTGQRCTATSRLILHDTVHDQFVERLIERAAALRLGDGLDPSTDVGPLINERQLERVEHYVKVGQEEGASLVAGGRRDTKGDLAQGWFYQPTIFTGVKPHMTIAQEEIFGPVLSVFPARSLEEGMAFLNDTHYGLSSSIYTRDLNAALQSVRDVQTGIVYVNSPTIGAEAHLPFGGRKNSGNGHREGGDTVYDIFTEWKTVFVDYSGKLQKAQIDVEQARQDI